MNLYFVRTYSNYGAGGMVIRCETIEDAIKIANHNTKYGSYTVDAQDVELISETETGLLVSTFYEE